MHVAAIVLSVALALLFFGSGGSKLLGDNQSGRREHLRADQRLWSLIGVLEVAGGRAARRARGPDTRYSGCDRARPADGRGRGWARSRR